METNTAQKWNTGKTITRLISLGLIVVFFANPKAYWPGAFLGIVMYMSILEQFTSEQIKSRGGFERGGSWAIFVIGIILSILLATLTPEIGVPSYKGLYEFLFCSQGVWGRTSDFEWQVIVIFTILTPSWFALDKSSAKEFFASMFFVLILLFIASKFVECEIPKGSLPEQLGITSYKETGLVWPATDSTHSTVYNEKEEILSPAIREPIRFVKKWYLGAILGGFILWIVYYLLKKEERGHTWILLKWILFPILLGTLVGWLSTLATGPWKNFFQDITNWAESIFLGFFIFTTIPCYVLIIWNSLKTKNNELV